MLSVFSCCYIACVIPKTSDMAETCENRLPADILKMLTPKGFEEEVYTALNTNKHCRSLRSAYDVAEEKYAEHFGCNKYSSYISFLVARSVRMKRESAKKSKAKSN